MSKDNQLIRDVSSEDAEAICEIYNYYVTSSIITFEEALVMVSEMQKRIKDCSAVLPWLVYEDQGIILGYAYASMWKRRSAYQHTAESTVYLSNGSTGKGIGGKLYQALIDRLRTLSFHSVIGGVALPNTASVALHEKLGFEKVAHFKEVGWKMDRWIDVGYWELILQESEK